MKTKRVILENLLETLTSFYSSDRKVVLQVSEELKNKHNMLEVLTNSIFGLTTPLGVLSDSALYAFTKALYNATKGKDDERSNPEKINPETHFTPLEIEQGNKWKYESKDKSLKPITFEKAIKINDDLWISYINISEISEYFSNGSLQYDPETQRPLKREIKGDRIVEKIDINPKSVSSIDKGISEQTFITNCITINVPEKLTSKIEYNPNSGVLTIPQGNITDGFHRCRGAIKAYSKNNNLDFRFAVMISAYDIDKAKQFIRQEDKRNPLNKEYSKSLDVDDFSNKIVQNLNQKKGYLRGKITTDPLFIKTKQALVMFSDLRDSIELVFAPSNDEQVINHTKIIFEGLKAVIETKPELTKNAIEGIEWCSYIVLIQQAYKLDDWHTIVELLTTKINIETLGVKVINKNTVKKINEYVKSLINSEVL